MTGILRNEGLSEKRHWVGGYFKQELEAESKEKLEMKSFT